MLITDPNTARRLHQADLHDAAEYRRTHRGNSRPSGSRSRRLERVAGSIFGSKRPTEFDRSLPILAGLNDRRLRRLESHFALRRFAGGEILGVQGETVREFGLVLGGQIGVVLDGEIVAVLAPGTHYGALSLLHPVGNAGLKTSLHALGDGVVAIAPADRFLALMDEFPSVAQNVRNVVRERRAYFRNRVVTPDPIRYPVAVG